MYWIILKLSFTRSVKLTFKSCKTAVKSLQQFKPKIHLKSHSKSQKKLFFSHLFNKNFISPIKFPFKSITISQLPLNHHRLSNNIQQNKIPHAVLQSANCETYKEPCTCLLSACLLFFSFTLMTSCFHFHFNWLKMF